MTVPPAFGRFAAIQNDHEHLGATLRLLGEMCAALEAQAVALPLEHEPARLICDFVSELSQHFAAEEAEGYFATIAREQPALASAIDELKAEHASMLGTLADLSVAAADERRWRAFARGMRRFIEQFRAHEHRETQLMQRSVLREEGTGAD